MKLRRHRRAAKTLAGKVTANRKAATAVLAGDKTEQVRGGGRSFRFRVEFWKLEPEIRIGHGEIELSEGDLVRDLGWALAERMLDFCSKRIPEAPSTWDAPVEEFRASDDDVPF